MKREFTQREKALLLILTALLLAVGYARLFSAPVSTRLAAAQARLADAQDALLVEQTKLAQMQNMEKELETLKKNGTSPAAQIPEYDNIENVMVQLGGILGAASNYQLTFSDLKFGDDYVARPIQMTFTAGSYQVARTILRELSDCPYRCAVSEITASAGEGDIAAEPVKVEATVIFYEQYNAAAAADDPANSDTADTGAASAAEQ